MSQSAIARGPTFTPNTEQQLVELTSQHMHQDFGAEQGETLRIIGGVPDFRQRCDWGQDLVLFSKPDQSQIDRSSDSQIWNSSRSAWSKLRMAAGGAKKLNKEKKPNGGKRQTT